MLKSKLKKLRFFYGFVQSSRFSQVFFSKLPKLKIFPNFLANLLFKVFVRLRNNQ